MSHHSDLIDTTQMYLRTIYELEEEGIVPLRARIAERLAQSGPTVSQTVARMERDGLLHVADDRHLQLTESGRKEAVAVMRKHRLAERLLADVIGLEWDQVHIEACRWEHVMSDAVERRILSLLDKPLVCPHGNPIPGLEDLGLPFDTSAATADVILSSAAEGDVVIERISEQLQSDTDLMRRLDHAQVLPGKKLHMSRPERDVVLISTEAGSDEAEPEGIRLHREVTDHIFVRELARDESQALAAVEVA